MAAQDAVSASLMAREALAISVSPFTQKVSNPPPVPTLLMLIWPAKPSSVKLWAMASSSGYTVDEPAAFDRACQRGNIITCV